jgi:hypothetical protein
MKKLALSVMFLIAACGFGFAQDTVTLDGHVLDADTQAAIAGAHVVLFPAQPPPPGEAKGFSLPMHPPCPPIHTVTDVDGSYALDAIPAGIYSLQVFARDYTRYVEELDLTVSVQDHTVLLQPIVFGSLSGVVTDSQTLAPIPGVVVRLSVVVEGHGGAGRPIRAVTDDLGYYHFDSIPQATYGLRAMKQGFSPFTAEVEIAATPAVLDFSLVPLAYGAIEGTVTDAQTLEPLEGVHVTLGGGMPGDEFGGHQPHFAAITDAQGFYHIEQVPAGDYTLRAGAPGYALATASVTIVDSQTTTQDVALTPIEFGTLTGLVFDQATAAPLEGALVMLGGCGGGHGDGHGGGGGGCGFHAITGADGTFSIVDIPTGEYQLGVFKMGYAPYQAPITIVVGPNEVSIGLQGM